MKRPDGIYPLRPKPPDKEKYIVGDMFRTYFDLDEETAEIIENLFNYTRCAEYLSGFCGDSQRRCISYISEAIKCWHFLEKKGIV